MHSMMYLQRRLEIEYYLEYLPTRKCSTHKDYLEGKYTEWPKPQKAENRACDRQSGLNDSAPRNHILVAWDKVA